MRRFTSALLFLIFAASILVGFAALSSSVEAGPPCVIRCALGVCQKCCVGPGGWVCKPL